MSFAFETPFRSAVHWNGFIAPPVLAKLHGDESVALVAVIIVWASVPAVTGQTVVSFFSIPPMTPLTGLIR